MYTETIELFDGDGFAISIADVDDIAGLFAAGLLIATVDEAEELDAFTVVS